MESACSQKMSQILEAVDNVRGKAKKEIVQKKIYE